MISIKVYIMAIILVTLLNIFLKINNKNSEKNINWNHYIVGYILILYFTISLVDFVGFPFLQEWIRLVNRSDSVLNLNLNLIPFKDGFEISNILNIIFFIPCGFLPPLLWKKYCKLSSTMYYGLFFSIIIEFSQLFTRWRATDVNDLITNLVGTLLGWIVFKITKNIIPNFVNKSVFDYSNSNYFFKLEPYLYIFIAILSTFFFLDPF